MKILFFALFISLNVYSQDCNSIQKFTSFHGLKFGNLIPDSLKKVCKYDEMEEKESGYKSYNLYLRDESTSSETFFKYESWVMFGSPFKDIIFDCTKEDKLFRIMLMRTLDLKGDDSVMLWQNGEPLFWADLKQELISLFAQPTHSVDTTDLFGSSLIETWECDKIKIEATCRYEGFGLGYFLSIVDKSLELASKIEKYTQ